MIQNVGDTVTQIGATDVLSFSGSTGYLAQINISGTDVLIDVTGALGNTVEWHNQTTVIPTN